MAKRQNFVVGSTNPTTVSKTTTQLNTGWNKYEVLKAGDLDGVFNAVSDYSNDSSNEIANAIQSITGSQPTGETQTELAGALNQLRQNIETSSLTFKGYIATSAPSSSTYALVEGNIWINSATLPTSFPIAASSIKEWNGTAWVNYSSTYTPADFDFFRNINDNEGYYWFGGQWTVMSTDMATQYFTLNQTSGKWEIKSSVNLPGNPTTTTASSDDNSTKIATTAWVRNYAQPAGTLYEPDLFDTKWRDATTSNTRWALSDGNWKTNTNGYNHLVDDYNSTAEEEFIYISAGTAISFYRYPSLDVSGASHPYAYLVFSGAQYVVYGNHFTLSTNEDVYSSSASDAQTAGRVTSRNTESRPLPLYENVAGIEIRYYSATDGHKIVLANEESNVAAIYAATGVAWYYVLDTTNTRFKLPRSKHNKYAASNPVIGNGYALGITEGTNTGAFASSSTAINNPVIANNGYGAAVGTSVSFSAWTDLKAIGVTTDSTKSGLIAQQTEDTGQYKYLYFYVG